MTTLTTAELDARVARGAALLDEKLPDWLNIINCDDLDLSDVYYCIGGQLADADYQVAGYETVMGELGLPLGPATVAHGFSYSTAEAIERVIELGGNDLTEIYAPLTDAWKRLITSRRGDAS